MAAMAPSARDIVKANGSDTLTGVGAMSVPVIKTTHPLPTPPNSISPNLPPHANKPYGTRSTTAQQTLEHVESDLDLQGADASEQDGLSERGHDVGSLGFESTGAITPALLAKHHLPEILLAHGPLAIRHIMGYLTTSVPGFSGIPPAKARRLVVGALEGKGNGNDGAGMKGDVKFEKVGWGRWDARMKGQAARSPPPTIPSSYSAGMPIAKKGGYAFDRTRLNAPGSSWAGDSAVFSHDDDMDAMMEDENEADRMSLDESCSSSEAPSDDDEVMNDDDPEDITDDEDWAALGAAALRAASYASGPGRNLSSHVHTGGISRSSGMAKSVPLRAFSQPQRLQPPTNNLDLAAFGMTSDAQEREAVEALLRLGSV